LLSGKRTVAQEPAPPPAQAASPKTDATSKHAQSPPATDNQEVSSRDTPTTFKVRVNLVLVRVVVRDASGKVVSGLKKEDFQLFDNRKLQAISSFNVETRNPHGFRSGLPGRSGVFVERRPHRRQAAVLPQRFVSMVFDDVTSQWRMRLLCATRHAVFWLACASDRVSINTTSGQFAQEFTDDHEALKKALFGLFRGRSGPLGFHDCPDVGYYQADLIVNKSDEQAMGVATEEAVQCAFSGDERMAVQARSWQELRRFELLHQGILRPSMPTGIWRI